MWATRSSIAPLAPRLIAVRSEGEDVVLEIGGWSARVFFEVALVLSDWIEQRAKEARASSSAAVFRAAGILHDSSDPRYLDAGQPNRPGRIAPLSSPKLRESEVRVSMTPSSVAGAEGMVILFAKGAEVGLPPSVAFSVAQWIRLRAKESQRRAGDAKRPWRAIIESKREQHGPDYTGG